MLPAARADLLRRAGRVAEAAAAYRDGRSGWSRTEPERRFLERRLVEVSTARTGTVAVMDMKLELVVVPGRRRRPREGVLHRSALGFAADVDVQPAPGVRVVQVTPPGSGCSIGFGTGSAPTTACPVRCSTCTSWSTDLAATRAELLERGVAVAPVTDVGGGVRYAAFSDPDGNGFLLQEMAWRTGDAF